MDFGDDGGFRLFASALEQRLDTYTPVPRKKLLQFQRKQIKNLVGLENKFRKALIRDSRGPGVYKKFVAHIVKQKNGILSARPYFRERQTMFSEEISEVLKKKSDKALYRFRFNFNFILFALKQYKWGDGSEVAQLAKQIQKQRMELLEMNIPLAISQARIFWSATPKSHLSYMDLVQIHVMGLLIAIDKFVPPGRGLSMKQELEEYRKFRAVAIGRMMGDRIEQYSETMLHFFPADKRKIYRALKALRRQNANVSMEDVTESVNKDIKDTKHHTNPEEISQLLAGASHVSGDMSIEPDGETTLDRIPDKTENDPYAKIEDEDAIVKIGVVARELPLFEKKLLKLKGLLR